MCLSRHKEVAYLDTDIGQPEFTVPGCISLHVLNNPIVGMFYDILEGFLMTRDYLTVEVLDQFGLSR